MPTAVIRVHFASPVQPGAFEQGVAFLRERGIALVEYTAIAGVEARTEVSLLREGAEKWTADDVPALCMEAFGVPAQPGPVTYMSRGTDADAESVLARFGLAGFVRREFGDEGEVVTVTVSSSDMRRVPESRLHTALEAALNAEVRIALVSSLNEGRGIPAAASSAGTGEPVPGLPEHNPRMAPS